MRIRSPHRWNLAYPEAVALQERLRGQVRIEPLPMRTIRFVAGADIAISRRLDRLIAAVVVYRFPDLERVETCFASVKTQFPYIPGLLSFREIPAIIACLRKVESPVDTILCDGHGIAHPRGLGLASHLGLLLGTPSIGCAKSRLVGTHDKVGPRRGDHTPLVYGNRRVGTVLRTRDGVKPLFVSPGHLVDHAASRRIALACASRYRLPEPTRWADRLAGEERRRRELDTKR
jgi:deoxyribonuclease V